VLSGTAQSVPAFHIPCGDFGSLSTLLSLVSLSTQPSWQAAPADHRHKLGKIKRHYAAGCETASRMLTSGEISRLAPTFVKQLGSILGVQGERAIDIISRKRRVLTAQEVESLLGWLDRPQR
jgi:hypothetical protein